jgi:glutamine amidotransferase
MGWDTITIKKQHPVLRDIKPNDEFYFVHSFYPLPAEQSAVLALCDYEIVFPVIIGKENLIATQFHPEKSGPTGLKILENFAQWDGSIHAE